MTTKNDGISQVFAMGFWMNATDVTHIEPGKIRATVHPKSGKAKQITTDSGLSVPDGTFPANVRLSGAKALEMADAWRAKNAKARAEKPTKPETSKPASDPANARGISAFHDFRHEKDGVEVRYCCTHCKFKVIGHTNDGKNHLGRDARLKKEIRAHVTTKHPSVST
jgi:hypothetical protein